MSWDKIEAKFNAAAFGAIRAGPTRRKPMMHQERASL
jgi:hypothetical protein